MLVAGAGFGAYLGAPILGVLSAGMLYGVWCLWQLFLLTRWLSKDDLSEDKLPSNYGIWLNIAEQFEQLRSDGLREQVRLRQVIAKSRRATAALSDGVVMLSRGNEIEWFNGAASELLGLRPGDIGEPVVNLIRQPSFLQFIDERHTNQMLSIESPLGKERRLNYQLAQYGDSDFLLTVRDTTRMFKLEKMRKDFVANVSHELKTPLTVIRGYVEMMADSPDAPKPWKGLLQQMEKQVGRMTNLINDLLSLTKLETDESGQNREVIPVQPLLERIAGDARAVSANSIVTIDCPEPFSLLGNEGELFSAFSNLVINAVKYAGEDPEVLIVAEVDDDGASITVSDNGQGIDSVHLPRLTERFYRVDKGRDSSTGGTGLGLAIVKHVLLRHNATLDIQSKVGRGSSFCCSFPSHRVFEELPAA